MSDDAELELFRNSVNCAALLEQFGGGWALDQRESTRNALKYRGGPGQIIIVNHGGHGWWEATSSAKGPGTLAALETETARLAASGGALVIATDANTAGDCYAERLSQLAETQRLRGERLRPPDGLDWNDVLKRKGRGEP